MKRFNPSNYSPKVAELLSENRLCELGPGHPNSTAKPLLDSLQPEELVPSVSNRDMADGCIAGLWLWHDYLDRSHDFSQKIHSSSGSLWHGIMHRREPDYSNSKYWYRRVGDHPIYEDLLDGVKQLAREATVDAAGLDDQTAWDPFRFVDLCSSVAQSGSDTELFCRKVAQLEWQLLFDFCYQRA